MKKLLLLLLLLASPAWATTFFVRPNGSDSNTCVQAQSSSTPFATISKLINGNPCSLTGGDTIEVHCNSAGGSCTFTDRFDCNANPSTQCIPGGSSFASAVTLKARGGDIVTIKPTGNGRVFSFDTSSQDYIIVGGSAGNEGFIIDGDNDASGNLGVWVEDDAHHIRIQNNEIINTHASGVGCALTLTGATTGVEILSNRIHNNGTNTSLDHGVYVGCTSAIVSGNAIYSNAARGVQVFNGSRSDGVDNVQINANRVYSNGYDGILFDGASSKAYNNVVYGNGLAVGGDGIRAGATAACNACLIANNTVFDTPGTGILIDSGMTNVVVQNNISYLNGTNYTDGGTGTTHDHNLEGVNPSFVNSAGGDFHVNLGSTAIDTGTTVAAVTTDFDGVTRPKGAAYDIGAFEFQTTPPGSGIRIFESTVIR